MNGRKKAFDNSSFNFFFLCVKFIMDYTTLSKYYSNIIFQIKKLLLVSYTKNHHRNNLINYT